MPPRSTPIRVLLVDDHAMVRRGMRDFLSLHDDLEIVGEAADGAAAVDRAAALRPDVVVMDLLMPGVDGIDATARIKAADPDIEIVAITSFVEENPTQCTWRDFDGRCWPRCVDVRADRDELDGTVGQRARVHLARL